MPLLWLSLAFLAGILLAANIPLPTSGWLALAGLGLVLGLLFPALRNRVGRFHPPDSPIANHALSLTHLLLTFPYSLIPLFFALGAARYQSARPDMLAADFIAAYNDRFENVNVRGVLVEPPDVRDAYTNLKIRAEAIQLPEGGELQAVHGLLLARAWDSGDWHYGDRLLVQGELKRPEEDEDFSYRDYLAQQNVYSVLENAKAILIKKEEGNRILAVVYRFKEHALETVYQLWPDPEASLLAGILLGVDSGIPEDVQQAFNDTGTSHIIAISGFNMTIVAGLFFVVFGRLFGRFKGAAIAVAGIAFYTLLVGAGPSVVRAALMGCLTLFAYQLGRRQVGLLSLILVAAVMVAFNPLILWNVGFQLSFAATLGLILYAQPLTQAFVNFTSRRLPPASVEWVTKPVSELVLFTVAAQLTTLPILIYYFQKLSLISLIANPLVLPAQPPVMILGGLALLLGMLFYPLGQLAAWLAWPFVVYTIRAVEFLAELQGSALDLGKVNWLVVVSLYVLLFTLTFASPRVKQVASNLKPGLALAALGVLTVVVWRAALAAPDGRLHLIVLDTHNDLVSGDALLIQTPAGRSVLVNGGPSARQLSDALGRRLAPGQRQLDWLIVGASDEGELDSLTRTLDRFPASRVLWAGPQAGSRGGRELRTYLAEVKIPVLNALAGQTFDLGEGALLRVLTAGERGAVFLVEWKNFRVLLPIGVNFEDLEALEYGRAIGPVTALLLAEHGYAPANPPEWIANLRPQVILLSVGAGDRQGLPSQETLQTILGYPLLRTDRNGWIHLTTDGEHLGVEVERK